MRIIVESMRRLYQEGKVTREKIQSLDSITAEEKAYILGEQP